MNKELELAKNKTLDTMSEVMTTEELKILANVMDREFERLSRTQRVKKAMVIVVESCYNLGVKRVMTS